MFWQVFSLPFATLKLLNVEMFHIYEGANPFLSLTKALSNL